MIKQLPISVFGGRKHDVRSQFAALCYRIRKGKVRVLLITSRGVGRWIVPKGWPIDGYTPAQTAVEEAWEEAGVRGTSDGRCIGIYSYAKETDGDTQFPCLGMVFAVEVEQTSKDYPEAAERERKWVSRKKAARMVDEPELSRIILDFDPRRPA